LAPIEVGAVVPAFARPMLPYCGTTVTLPAPHRQGQHPPGHENLGGQRKRDRDPLHHATSTLPGFTGPVSPACASAGT
jgi:hypothetical protein